MSHLSGITHAAEHASVSVARTHVLQIVDGQVVSRMLFIPICQLLPADQGARPRIGAGGEENLIHSGGNAA